MKKTLLVTLLLISLLSCMTVSQQEAAIKTAKIMVDTAQSVVTNLEASYHIWLTVELANPTLINAERDAKIQMWMNNITIANTVLTQAEVVLDGLLKK